MFHVSYFIVLISVLPMHFPHISDSTEKRAEVWVLFECEIIVVSSAGI